MPNIQKQIPETYAVCKADMLHKGEGESADHTVGGAGWSTLSHDAFPAQEFDFMLANPEWEKLSILLNLLTPKSPAPEEQALSKGILEAIDMDSYRVEKKAAMKIALLDNGRRDRAGADGCSRPQARTRTRSPEQQPQDVQ